MFQNSKLFLTASERPLNLRVVRRARARGFTLTEMIVSMTVMSFVTVGVLSFFIQFYKMGFVNEQRNLINRDLRVLTGELVSVGRQSNYFTIYDSIAVADRDDDGDRKLDGTNGDLLVFTFTEAGASASDSRLIYKVVAYYRDTTSGDGELGPVRRYELDVSPASGLPIEDLLPSVATLQAAPQVIELSQGLADGRLFYNFWGHSIMVNGLIYHGNDAKWVTETYNFTISPRG